MKAIAVDRMNGEIIQIIPWEKKEHYLDNSIDFGDMPMDVLVVREQGRVKFTDRLKKRAAFNALCLSPSLSIVVERPHDFKEGDRIDIEITVKKELV